MYFSVLFTVIRVFYIPGKDTNSMALYLLEDNLFSANTHNTPVLFAVDSYENIIKITALK